MQQQAAFRATYSDLRFVKTRKVCQIVLEMPLENADAFLSAFGTPNPAEEKWCALARLVDYQPPEEAQPEPDHHGWHDLRPSAQAAIRCEDPLFQQFFLTEDKDDTVRKLRNTLKVASRSELDRNDEARNRWERVDGEFIEWKRRRKL